jgi:hypothetical protein
MSFDKIVKSDVIRKKQEIKIGDYVFYANELTYPQRLALAVKQNQADQIVEMVVSAITDESGKHMTAEQAVALPEEIFNKFFETALDLNKVEQTKN